jgi:hypothetical protein
MAGEALMEAIRIAVDIAILEIKSTLFASITITPHINERG